MAGDDEDGGAAAVTEGAAAAVVLVDGEEDGEVRRVEGVAKVVSAFVDGIGTGEAKTAGLGAPATQSSMVRRLRRDLGAKNVPNRCALSR